VGASGVPVAIFYLVTSAGKSPCGCYAAVLGGTACGIAYHQQEALVYDKRSPIFPSISPKTLIGAIVLAMLAGASSGLLALDSVSIEDVAGYKCAGNKMGCVMGNAVFCYGSCGPKGCSCSSYEPMVVH